MSQPTNEEYSAKQREYQLARQKLDKVISESAQTVQPNLDIIIKNRVYMLNTYFIIGY